MDRIVTVENAQVTRELVSPRISIEWDYISNTGPINFYVEEVVSVDGVEVQKHPAFTLTTSIQEMSGRNFDVPLPDGTTAAVPGLLVVAVFKQAFQELIAEKQS